ncbi:ADP-ribose pyrophosphatase [hydrothermal vent metagenome]|uniref:ADP-ribose pyrophosphatase n=1 Tax=hydrothermal vent metagenome TaxID=652676 RepID=A0A3B1C868_9ZZZZ
MSVVFVATAEGTPKGGDDAKSAALFRKDNIPSLAFDHEKILANYFSGK